MTTIRSIKGKNILVTGGAGFIGSHLIDYMIAGGAKNISVIDNLFLGTENNLTDSIETGKVNLYRDDAEFFNSLDYIFNKDNIDIVFNCATKALNYSFENPSNSFQTNVTVILNLLEMQRKGAFKSLCHFSTSEVYGTALYEPMDEKHPRYPTTAYAAGKAAADLALESYVKMFGLDCCIVRPFNNFGPRQNYKGKLAGLIPQTIWKILKGNPPEIHGDGKQSRDFIYVKDTVKAVLKLFETLSSGETVNISTNNQVDVNKIVDEITKIMNYKGEIKRKIKRNADVKCHNGNNEKIKSLIEFNPTNFASSLEETISWYEHQYKNENK